MTHFLWGNKLPQISVLFTVHAKEVCNWGHGSHRSKITKKVHKPPQNHYIEWPVFSDIGLNSESQGEKGRTCKKYKILIGSRVFFFHFIHDLPFSPGHLLESEERFVNLFCNFSPLCAAPRHHCTARDANISVPKDIFLQAPEFSS